MKQKKKWISFLSAMLLILAAGFFTIGHFYTLPVAPASTEASFSVSTQKKASSQAIFTPGDRKAISAQSTTDSSLYAYIVNTNSKVFHFPDCPSVDQMKERNKLFSSQTRDELIAQGYRPCGNCKP